MEYQSDKDESNSAESDTGSEDSLPRQSVFRRTSAHLTATKPQKQLENKSKNENLSDEDNTGNEDENGNKDSIRNDSLSLRVSISRKYSTRGLSNINNDDDDVIDNQTKLVCHSAGNFYKKDGSTSGRCFYKDAESSDDDNGVYGNSRRKASKKAKYVMFSESEDEEEVGVATGPRSKKRKIQGQSGGYNSDSDFVVS